MATVTFRTEPFTCPSCITKIESAVSRLEGVTEVTVLFNSHKVKVTFDERSVAAETIARTITDLGYPVTTISRGRPAVAHA